MAMAYIQIFADKEELLEPFDDAERGRLLTAMLSYGLHGIKPVMTGNERYIWPVFRQMINNSRRAMESKQSGGRARHASAESSSDQQNPAEPSRSQQTPAETSRNQQTSADASRTEQASAEPSSDQQNPAEQSNNKNQESRDKNQEPREKREGEGECEGERTEESRRARFLAPAPSPEPDNPPRDGPESDPPDEDGVFPAPSKAKIKPMRHRYGQYQNVLMSDDDIGKLKQRYPLDWQERIERLSVYKASTGKAYKNDLATIDNWARRDAERGNAGGSHPGHPCQVAAAAAPAKIGLVL